MSVQNIGNILALLDIVDRLIGRASEYAALIRKARAEGRDVSAEELSALAAKDNAARAALEAAIAAASP